MAIALFRDSKAKKIVRKFIPTRDVQSVMEFD